MWDNDQLAGRLGQASTTAAAWQPLYDKVVKDWRRLGIGDDALSVGDLFPEFALPDARGCYVSLDELLADGPIVLSFNRGEWCPYCRTELEEWHCALPYLVALHGRFVAVTPEVGGRAQSLETILGGDAQVLCDVDHALALTVGLAFFAGNTLLDDYRAAGLDLATLYGSESSFLPVPATFVIDTDRTIAFAFADVDFRHRAEPPAVLAAVRGLGR